MRVPGGPVGVARGAVGVAWGAAVGVARLARVGALRVALGVACLVHPGLARVSMKEDALEGLCNCGTLEDRGDMETAQK